jgi:LPXTG-motif cell wall-anchored protein
MIQFRIHKTVVLVPIMLVGLFAIGQGGIRVKATIDRQQILIGEPVNLRVTVEVPENEPIRFFEIDTIPKFEFIDKGKIDTSNTSSGTTLSQTIKMTSFDSGYVAIPSFEMAGGLRTDSFSVLVSYSAFDPDQDYHDIKDVIDVTAEQKQPWWWWAAAGAALVIILLVILLRKKKKPVLQKTEPPVNAYEEAMKQLAALRTHRGDARDYYTKLIDIFRVYILRKKGINSKSETTDDLIIQLREIGLPTDVFDGIAQTLRMADSAKFAKFQPSAQDDENSFNYIQIAIKNIEQMKSDVV